MDNQLKLCPFCGSLNISEGEVLATNPNGGASTQSMCRECGALGPEAHLRDGEVDFGDEKATTAWNTRAALHSDAAGAPVAWVRYRSDGGFEGPIMDSDSRMCDTRRSFWTPLYGAPATTMALEPEGFALVPLRLTRAMDEVLSDEGWQWEDLLAAAGAITEDQYNEIAVAADAAAPSETCAHDYVRSDRVCTECGEKAAQPDERAAPVGRMEMFSGKHGLTWLVDPQSLPAGTHLYARAAAPQAAQDSEDK